MCVRGCVEGAGAEGEVVDQIHLMGVGIDGCEMGRS